MPLLGRLVEIGVQGPQAFQQRGSGFIPWQGSQPALQASQVVPGDGQCNKGLVVLVSEDGRAVLALDGDSPRRLVRGVAFA